MNCVFCQIIAGKIPAKFLYESDQLVAFPDIHPSADTHILIVPKQHINSLAELTEDHGSLLSEIYQVSVKLVKDQNLVNDLYRIVVNGGKAQQIPHLHFHFLGGKWRKFV